MSNWLVKFEERERHSNSCIKSYHNSTNFDCRSKPGHLCSTFSIIVHNEVLCNGFVFNCSFRGWVAIWLHRWEGIIYDFLFFGSLSETTHAINILLTLVPVRRKIFWIYARPSNLTKKLFRSLFAAACTEVIVVIGALVPVYMALDLSCLDSWNVL